MYKSYVFAVVLGLFGVIVLVSLGIWQLNRLEWKTSILTQINTKMNLSPVELPSSLKKETDQYKSVIVKGRFMGTEIHVLSSIRFVGPGFKVIAPLKLDDGRIILVDRGFVLEKAKKKERFIGPIEILGNLIWPDETDRFTPEPDLSKNIWFSRDLAKMATYLNAEEVLVVAKSSEPPSESPKPQPIGLNIPNDHLKYAITWFSLAFVWLGMTSYLVWRIKEKKL